MSGGNLSGVYHFYTMAVTAATMVYIIMFVDKKILNHTLAINSPFQTFAVGLLIYKSIGKYHHLVNWN